MKQYTVRRADTGEEVGVVTFNLYGRAIKILVDGKLPYKQSYQIYTLTPVLQEQTILYYTIEIR